MLVNTCAAKPVRAFSSVAGFAICQSSLFYPPFFLSAMSHLNRKLARSRVHRRIRKKIAGTSDRPRLAVHFSNNHVYAQVINDLEGRTILSASTAEKDAGKGSSSNISSAAAIGKKVAEKAKAAKIEKIVFDRGGHVFHGKVKALADAAREAGLQF